MTSYEDATLLKTCATSDCFLSLGTSLKPASESTTAAPYAEGNTRGNAVGAIGAASRRVPGHQLPHKHPVGCIIIEEERPLRAAAAQA